MQMREVGVGDLDGVRQSGDVEAMESQRDVLKGLGRLRKGPGELKMRLEKDGRDTDTLKNREYTFEKVESGPTAVIIMLIKSLTVYKLNTESTESVDLHKNGVITDIRNDVTLQNKKA